MVILETGRTYLLQRMSTSIARVHSKEWKLHSIFPNPFASWFRLLLASWSEDYLWKESSFYGAIFFRFHSHKLPDTLARSKSLLLFLGCLPSSNSQSNRFQRWRGEAESSLIFHSDFFPVPSNKWALEESLSVSFGFCPGEVADFAPCNINSLSWILTDWAEPALFIVIWFHNSCFHFVAGLVDLFYIFFCCSFQSVLIGNLLRT